MADEILDDSNQVLAPTSPHPLGLRISRAQGAWLYDEQGKKYLDLIAGLAVNNIGHSQAEVVHAIKQQADQYLHVIPYGEFIQQPQQAFATALCEILPKKLDCAYFVNSGTEAIEAALKLAKRVTGRTQLIGFEKSYHGSTHGSLSITGNEQKRFRNRPLLPDAFCIPFNDMHALNMITKDTAAVVVECVQGDAGVRIADTTWLKALRKRTNEEGALLIFDEVQTGFGRTGKLFAFEHFGIVPDVLVLGKALGGGLPMGAFISSTGNMKQLSNRPILGHITTFGGHPLCCVAGLAALHVLKSKNLVTRATHIGKRLKEELQHHNIKEIRGIGAMLAIELRSAAQVQQVVLGLLEEGILGFWFLSCPEAFRLAPPLCLSDDEISLAVAGIRKQLDRL